MKKKYAVIGDPISHSMSPAMHNDLFSYYQIPAEYHPVHIKRGQLKDGMIELKKMDIAGFNVTIPHKTDIIPLLDELDPLSEAIGAVNTVVNENGRWIGYNTDGSGYIRGLQAELTDLMSKKVLIIGTGGAARAIYYTMASMGIERLDVCNRTIENANKLVEGCKFSTKTNILEKREAEERLADYDLIIQTTSIGMIPHLNSIPLSIENLRPCTFVSDIIYNPLETKFLMEAKKAGSSIQNGITMFVYQGALSFEKWTGVFPDTKRMEENVLKQLGGVRC